MHAYTHVCRYICMCIFFAVSVTCTLQVLWALVHGRVCMLHRCLLTPTYASANTLAAGCAHMCICIYVCVCMYMHMDAYMRLLYYLTRWGVVARILCLYIRVHMHAYAYVCACMCVQVHVHMYVYAYMYVCVYVCLCICIHIHLYTRACGCKYAHV